MRVMGGMGGGLDIGTTGARVISVRGGRLVGSSWVLGGVKAPVQKACVPTRSSPAKW